MEYSIGESKGEAWLRDAPKHRGLSLKTQHSNTLPAGPLPSTRFSRGSTAPSDRRALERGVPRGGIEEPKRSSAAQSRAPQQRRTAVTSRLFPTYGVAYGSPVIITFFFFLSFSSLRKTRNGAERKKKKKATTAAGARTKRLIFSAEEIICYISPQPDNPLLLKDEVSINVCLEQM